MKDMTTSTKAITKPGEIRPGERRELKSLIKKKIAVLRAQVDKEHAEKVAQVDAAVAAQFKDRDARMEQFRKLVDILVRQANERLKEIIDIYADVVSWNSREILRAPYLPMREDGKTEARDALMSAARAEKAAAHQRLTELEVQLEEELTLDGLRTEAAHAFVRSMPTVEDILASVRNVPAIQAGVKNND